MPAHFTRKDFRNQLFSFQQQKRLATICSSICIRTNVNPGAPPGPCCSQSPARTGWSAGTRGHPWHALRKLPACLRKGDLLSPGSLPRTLEWTLGSAGNTNWESRGRRRTWSKARFKLSCSWGCARGGTASGRVGWQGGHAPKRYRGTKPTQESEAPFVAWLLPGSPLPALATRNTPKSNSSATDGGTVRAVTFN